MVSIVVAGLVLWVLAATWHSGDQQEQQASNKPPAVNFYAALSTKRGTLYCPLSVALDEREGHGLKAAMDAHLEIIDHEQDVEKLGCEELRAGLPVLLSSDAEHQATAWQSNGRCGMVEGDGGFIFSCDLANSPQMPASAPDTSQAPAGDARATSGNRVVSWDGASKFVGTMRRGWFQDCCTNGKEVATRYAYLRLDRPVDIRATPGDELEQAEPDVGRFELGALKAGTLPPDGTRIAVACHALWAGVTGHYALPVYCDRPVVAVLQ
ncbi:MAG: hypothetical protein KGJ96_14045 [Xanthomonadaceae bacterium]|nr:hypothetical protein [Xanthomonadaceae bacterium]